MLGHADVIPGGVLTRRAPATAFEVSLDNFTGPFDLPLGLISKHRLDITEIALARVTDDFIGYIRVEQAKPDGWDLSQATEFLLVAATLLDLKAAAPAPDRAGGRGGPRAHRGPGHPVRPAAAVPRVQGHRAHLRRADGDGRPDAARTAPGAAPRGAVAGVARAVTPEQAVIAAPGDGAQAGSDRRPRAPARPSRQRARAGEHHRCPAAP